jgi:predicted DsbA family dithiol-disulfide isomerase
MHPNAEPAARAAQAAKRQGKEWEMTDKLFANFRELTPENIDKYAGELGLDLAKFKADMASEAVKKEIAVDMAAVQAAGVRGTPTILINGVRFTGPRTLDGMKPVIDAEIKKADELIGKGTPIEKVYETLAKGS